MNIFDMYRRGYQIGNQEGLAGGRRRARWELALMHPITWIPGVDQESFINGYIQGYHEGIGLQSAMARINRQPP